MNFRVIEVLAIFATLRIVTKERLHFAGWRESNQQFTGSVANECPRVRHLARPENGIAGFQMETLGADLGNVFTF